MSDSGPVPTQGGAEAPRRLRFVWVATLIAAGVAAAAALEFSGKESTAARTRPNVLVVVMDTTRADRCSFLGYGRPTTPSLEEFAKDAVSFADAWSPAGWTGPAHASLFTGLRPERHGFHDGARNYLDAVPPTLAGQLAAAGYATGCFTNNNWVSAEFGLTRGFDRFEPLYARAGRPYPWARQTHTLAADWAGSVAQTGRPFFLFVNDMEPHLPYEPAADEQARFLTTNPTDAELKEARTLSTNEAADYALGAREVSDRVLATMADLYDAEIAGLDRDVGALLARLGAEGLLDSTIVVITSDHGEPLGEHRMIDHGHTLHRCVRHVPLIVRYPGTFDGGRVVRSVVRLEDVAPTILELCGLPVPNGIDGVPLTRDLEGRMSIAVQGAFPGRRAWLAESNPRADPARYLLGFQGVYDGRWHCLSSSDGKIELFDSTADPKETRDLAAEHPDIVERLRALMPLTF